MASATNTLTVRSRHDLNALTGARPFLTLTHRSVALDVPVLRPEERTDWEWRLTAAYNECGCNLGAICLMGGLAASVVLFVLARPASFRSGVAFTIVALASSIAASLGGKLAGVALGRWRFRRSIRKLTDLIAVREAGPTLHGAIP